MENKEMLTFFSLLWSVLRMFAFWLQNFNHERFVLAAQANRFARVCLEESIKWARQRRTFNTAHINHQVIRHKIGEMARRVESTHAWLEQLAFQYVALATLSRN